jgi:hypothetical protein
MNVNELAEALDDLDLISGYKVVAEAQTMLRQQQAEIEALKQSKFKDNNKVNNEPVAWFEQDENMKSIWYQCDKNDHNAIPLYTYEQITPSGFLNASEPIYPAKTLTDEEIDAISDEVVNLIDTYAGRREFARAILRKAQDK